MEQKLRHVFDQAFDVNGFLNKEKVILLEKQMAQAIGIKTPHSFSPKNDSQYTTQLKTLSKQEDQSKNEQKSQYLIKNRSHKQVLHDVRIYIRNNKDSILSALLSELKQLYEQEEYILTKISLINVMIYCLQYGEVWVQMQNGIQNVQEAKSFAHKIKEQLWNAKKLETLDELRAASTAGLGKGFKYFYFDAKKKYSRQDEWIKQIFVNIDEVLFCPCLVSQNDEGFIDVRNTKTDAVFTTRRSTFDYKDISYDSDTPYDVLMYYTQYNYKEQLPEKIRALCLISNTTFHRTVILSNRNLNNLKSLSLVNCVCPELIGAVNVENLCIFNVTKFDTKLLALMNKLQKCFFYKVKAKYSEQNSLIGMEILNYVAKAKNLQYLQISECPMGDIIKISYHLPELQYFIVEQCGCKKFQLKLNKCNFVSLLYFKVDAPVQLSGDGKLPSIMYFNNITKQDLLKIQYGFKRGNAPSDIYETVQDLTVSQYSISTFKSAMEQSALNGDKEQKRVQQNNDVEQKSNESEKKEEINDKISISQQKCVKWAEIYNEVLTESVDFENNKSQRSKLNSTTVEKSYETSQNNYIESSSVTNSIKVREQSTILQSVAQNTSIMSIKRNKIRGDNNIVIGKGNKVVGSSNVVLGNNNYVFIGKYTSELDEIK